MPSPGEIMKKTSPKPSVQSSGLLQRMTAAIQTNQFGNYPGGPVVSSARYIGMDAQGNAMYRIVVKESGRTHSRTVTWSNQKGFGTPQMKAKATGGISQPDPRVEVNPQARLRAIKDKWASWVTNMVSGNIIGADEARSFMNIINGFSGDPNALDQQFRLIERNIPVGGRAVERVFEPEGGFDIGGFGGGGGGGGFAGPVYRAPDRRVVEDYARGVMVSLVGTVDEKEVDRLADLYMRDHRRNFDSPNQEIDPGQSVVEAIRETDSYKQIHALRPKSEDERTWIASRRAAAERGGLDTEQQEDFAITQSTVGGDIDDVERAAGVEQFRTSGGNTSGTFLEPKLREITQAVFSGVVR